MLPVSLNFINGDPLFDRSKSKVQTTGRQEPCHTPQIPFAKINYFPDEGRTDISFSALPDGKSASRNNLVDCAFNNVDVGIETVTEVAELRPGDYFVVFYNQSYSDE